ncbi:cupin domain-containing protein [Marinilabilia rubra]|uniref:DNA-binding protein n=1 Tax=Marinilabilia rubra TaxID=2162893 RepID=A0A2U2BCL0_9BACT|nr:cupin domain-containing protein [Marinilabilia rubra]PWE00814.1 DNA-binding protein [Marinilabilia rubra]
MKPGEKIKLQREEKKLSLGEVAQRTLISEELLQKIESDEAAPSLGTLIKLARVFGVRLGTFLDDQKEKGAVVCRKEDNLHSENINVAGSQVKENLVFASLARQKSDRHMDPFLIEVVAGKETASKYSAHEGEEFIYILEGTVEVTYGKETHQLNAGDSIYYDSIVDHNIKVTKGQKALVLAVVYLPV